MTKISPTLEERVLIQELCARYAWALDTADTEGYAACFTEDAVVRDLHASDKAIVGRQAIYDYAKWRWHSDPNWAGRQHHLDQTIFEADPEGRPDHWHMKSYCWAFDYQRHTRGNAFFVGYYFDTVAKVDGEWLFRERLFGEWMGDILKAFPGHEHRMGHR